MRDFNHTVNVLVKAYLNDELQHENCAACAVGNIIAEAINAKPTTAREQGYKCDMKLWKRGETLIEPIWQEVFCTVDFGQQDRNPKRYAGMIKTQIDTTGYTWQELAKIEFIFEETGFKYFGEEKMFQSLMAVVDVLADIHGIDLKAKEEAKLLFVKP